MFNCNERDLWLFWDIQFRFYVRSLMTSEAIYLLVEAFCLIQSFLILILPKTTKKLLFVLLAVDLWFSFFFFQFTAIPFGFLLRWPKI